MIAAMTLLQKPVATLAEGSVLLLTLELLLIGRSSG